MYIDPESVLSVNCGRNGLIKSAPDRRRQRLFPRLLCRHRARGRRPRQQTMLTPFDQGSGDSERLSGETLLDFYSLTIG
jgi:hypothetical protein